MFKSRANLSGSTYQIIHSLSSILAIYLSFKINNGFNLVSFIVSIVLPYIYIIYAVATYGLDIIWKDAIHKKSSQQGRAFFEFKSN